MTHLRYNCFKIERKDIAYIVLIAFLFFLILFTVRQTQGIVQQNNEQWLTLLVKCGCSCPNVDYLLTFNYGKNLYNISSPYLNASTLNLSGAASWG